MIHEQPIETRSMEMPCLCDCGEWFDLNDGHQDKRYGSNKVICHDCNENQIKREVIEEQIDDLATYGNKKRQIRKLEKQLHDLGGKLNDF